MTACTVACSTYLPNADRIQHFKDVMEALEGSESLCARWCFCCSLQLSFSSLLDYLWIRTFIFCVLFIFKALESSKIVCVWLLFVCVCVFMASVLYY